MTKTLLITVGSLLALGAAVLTADRSGLIGSGNAAPGLIASDVRTAPGGAAAQEARPLEVLGAVVDCPPEGAGPEDSQQRYDESGSAFRVIGSVSSFNAVTIVVAGPTGEITANLGSEFELRGDLTPGAIVDVRGTIGDAGARSAHQVRSACVSAGVIDCASETDPQFQLIVESQTFEVTGLLESVTADQVRVLGPGVTVEILRDSTTQIDPGLTTGDPVTVEGAVLDDRQLRALTATLRCEIPTATPEVTPAPTAAATPRATTAADEDAADGCRRGTNSRSALGFEVDDGEVGIKRATVVSSDGSSITIETPAGQVVVSVGGDTEVSGQLDAAGQVHVDGTIQADGSVLAEDVKVLCEAVNDAQNDDEGDDEGAQGDDDDEGDDEGRRGSGSSRGRGREDDDGGEEKEDD
jgi:hypothetical protein